MRIAVRPCQTVPPHQQVPSSWIAAITRRVVVGVAERDQHLIEDDVVEDLVAGRRAAPRRSARRGGSSARSARPAPARPSDAQRGPHLDAARAPRQLRRVVRGLARRRSSGRYAARDAIAARSARRVAHEGQPAVVGHVEPLVRVGGPRVGAARRRCTRCARVGRGRGPQAEGAVDVHPGARRRAPRRRSRATGSKAPVLTLPACTQTMRRPGERAAARRRACGPGRRPAPARHASAPEPEQAERLGDTDGCTSSPTITVIGGAPNRPSASTSQPARASTAWRAAASAVKLAIVAPVTKRRRRAAAAGRTGRPASAARPARARRSPA